VCGRVPLYQYYYGYLYIKSSGKLGFTVDNPLTAENIPIKVPRCKRALLPNLSHSCHTINRSWSGKGVSIRYGEALWNSSQNQTSEKQKEYEKNAQHLNLYYFRMVYKDIE